MTGRRASRLRSAPSDWLPPSQPQNSTPARILRRVDIYAQQHRDWFLAFAAAMEPIDSVQSKQLAKAYLFLRTFVPRGLTGCFGHIRGNDVMDHVLCTNEHTFSRHRLAKQVTAAFRKLEEWMSGCDIWTTAVKKAREGDRTGRRNLSRKAPGLFSPAAIMAVLIIAYPDPDNHFHDLIGRLQIDWMVLQDRSELSIQHGFWKGMTSNDLGTVFNNNADEDWAAIVEMLADYDCILGPDFSACQKDIRPYLPEQFKAKVTLSNELSAIEDDIGAEEIEGDAQSRGPTRGHADSAVVEETGRPRIMDEPEDLQAATPLRRDSKDPPRDSQLLVQALSLQNHLNTDDSKVPPRAAERWLVAQLLEKQKPVLRAWCQHWERKIDEVSNARDQHIVRSLFMQSLCRLKNISPASHTQANAFMLVCVAESEARPSGEEQMDTSSLEVDPLFAVFSDAREEFRRMATNTGAPIALLEENLADQVKILRHFMQESPFSDHWPDLLQIEALYTRLLVLGYEDPMVDPQTVTFLRHERDNILNETNRELLRLDSWQTRAMLLPGSLNVLTGYQQQLFRETYCQGQDKPTLDLSKMPLMSISPSFVYPEAFEQEYPSLGKLLGILQMPRHIDTNQPNALCAPIPAASSRTNQSISPTRETHVTPNFAAEAGTTVKRLLPFGTAGHTAKMARTVHNSTNSPQRNVNMVSGQEANPLGACPPRAIRTPALPRTVGALNVITPENLRQELQLALHGMHERYTAHAVQATDGLINRIKTLEDKIGEGFNRLDSALKKVDDLPKFTAQVRADISEVKAGLQGQTGILNDMNARPQIPQLPPSPQPGQDGFLAQYPAPLGTSQDSYERTLLRAAWYYLNCLGNPDHSGWTDEAAWTAAINAFPNLEADHLQGALDHVHVQAYGCSFPRAS